MPDFHVTNVVFAHSARAVTLSVIALGLGACAADGATDTPTAALVQAAPELMAEAAAQGIQAETSSSAAMTINHAEGAYVAAVRTEGDGCPGGTFNTRVSEDGQVFTTTFSAFEVRVNNEIPQMSLNCRLAINLRSPGGRTFCVKQFGYTGSAFLEGGVSGRQTAEYFFNEQKLVAESARQDLVGPFDQDFVFTDVVRPEEEIWTPCEEARSLYVETGLEIQNGDPRASGAISIAAADGANTIQVELASHRCEMARDDGWTVGPFSMRSDRIGSATTTVTNTGRGSIGRRVN